MAHHNWAAIRHAYTTGLMRKGNRSWPTLEQCAKHFGVPDSSVRARSMREDWTSQKQAFLTTYEQEENRQKAQSIAIRSVAFDTRCLNAAERLLDHCEEVLKDLFRPDENGKPTRIPDPLYMARVANAFRLAQSIGRIALGVTAHDELFPASQLGNPDAGDNIVNVRRLRVVYERQTMEAEHTETDHAGDAS